MFVMNIDGKILNKILANQAHNVFKINRNSSGLNMRKPINNIY